MARVAPLEAVAEVVSPRQASAQHTVSVRVEVVALEPASKSAHAPAVPALEARASHYRFDDSDAAQLTAASTAAAMSQRRGTLAYATSAQLFDANALQRGVCIRVCA